MAKAPKTVEEVWKLAEVVIRDCIYKLDEGISNKRYGACYSVVFNFLCSESNGLIFYTKLRALFSEYTEKVAKDGETLPDEQLLVFFRKKWNDFKASVMLANNMFNYLNRTWVKTMTSNNEEVYVISMLADVIWRDKFFIPMQSRLTNAMLALIQAERNGQPVQTSVLADTVQCYVRLGLQKDNPKVSTLEIYANLLQKPLMVATDVYYTVESTNFLHENGVSEYLKKAEKRIAEEMTRLQSYLHPSTGPALNSVLDDVLIRRHLATLQSKVALFLSEDHREDLKRLYTLLARCGKTALEPVQDAVEKFIAQQGRNALAADADTAAANPDVFVAILLRVFRKYQTLIKDAFCEDAGFVAAQDKAFRDFVNKNAVVLKEDGAAASSGGDGVAKAPQLLAKYCDMILRKGPKHISDESEMEKTLDDVVALFKYLPDKDVFSLVYSKLLSKRLIQDNSGNDDFEASMINKLKLAQGLEYTSRLQRMVTDIATSKDINAGFKSYLDSNEIKLDVDFSVNVLASGCWPLNAASTPFNPPEPLVSAMGHFKKYYGTKFNGRKLAYLYHLSNGELAVSYLMKGRLRVVVSTYQLGILLHFDTAAASTVSFGDLRASTLLDEQTLKMALLALLKSKFVTSAAGPKHSAWNDATPFSLNGGFNTKRSRVNLNVQVAADGLRSAPAAAIDPPEIRRERELKLQAAIVRIMKQRRVLDHNNLVSEATTQVSKWFVPKVAVIKKVVEYLLEQQYIARQTNESGETLKSYEYVA